MDFSALRGRRIAVTGSTGGLGAPLCAALADAGASLVLLDRNAARSAAHRDRLLAAHPDIEVTCIPLDLESLAMARDAVAQLREGGIDIFIHNAGAYSIPRHLCDSGYDNVFQINFATPYYMIRALLPTLRARGGHVMAVGSIAHRYGKTDPCDIDFRTRRAASRVYGNAKRYLMFALYDLFRDETAVTLSIAHPGITPTNITAHYPRPIYALIKHPMKCIFMSPARASRCLLHGVLTSCAADEWIGPRLFDIWGAPRKRQLRSCTPAEKRGIAAAAEEVYETCRRAAEG